MIKILGLLLICTSAFAQPTHKQVPLIDFKLTVDGVMDEPEWQQALVIPLLYETSPAENVPAMVKTEAYFIDKGKSLVIGFKAEDPEPENIRAFLRDRDSAYDDDYLGVLLDTYNDERRALKFFVNPLGVQMDLIQSDNNEDDSWNAIWDSAGKITDWGYVVEMEIPYHEIQMPDAVGEKTWGLYAVRIHPRDDRRLYRNVAIDRNNSCFLCQSEKVSGFTNADRSHDLEITPTLTGLATKNRSADAAEFNPTETDVEAGVDVNWGINSNLTLNATINPDFSQVEADSAQLNVNQTFALFFPERRSFFLENSDYFDSNMNLVYTRNIADPDYGIRLVGKNDVNAYGFYYTNDTITNLLIPGSLGSNFTTISTESNNLVGRYRRDFGEYASTFGGTVTNREGGDYSNTVVSGDVNFRITPKDIFRLQLANSETQYPTETATEFDQELGTFSGSSYLARYNHNGRNWRFNAFHQNKDDGFRADSGFIGRVGTKTSVVGGGYKWLGSSEHWWNQIDIYSDWDATHDQNGLKLEEELEGRISIDLPLQSNINTGLGVRDRYWGEQTFRENFQYFNLHMKPFSGLDFGLHLNSGHAIDFANSRLADSSRVDFHFGGNLGAHFNYRVSYVYNNLSVDQGNIFTANQTDIRLSYQFNLRQRLRLAVIQTDINRDLSLYNTPEDYNKNNENLSTQLIYSYKLNPRTLLFVGYSDTGTEYDDIESFVTTDKNLFMKFSYAWKL